MRLLLDTHAFLWFVMGDPRLSSAARDAIEDPVHETWLSVASVWEIAIKHSLGKLTLTEPSPRDPSERFSTAPHRLTHLLRVNVLPFHHRDPFDRLLVAQSLTERMSVVSIEAGFDAYGVTRIW